MKNDRKRVYLYGYMAILGALMVGLGQFLVQYSPDYDPAIPYSCFYGVSSLRFSIGHFLMILFVPLYIYGYWHLFLALRGREKIMGKAVLSLGIIAFIIAGIWMGSRAQLGLLIQAKLAAGNMESLFDPMLTFYEEHTGILEQTIQFLLVIISVLFVWAIWDGVSWYPKWMMLFNPLLLMGLIYGLSSLVPELGKILLPSAMNIAHLILFIASMVALKQMEGR